SLSPCALLRGQPLRLVSASPVVFLVFRLGPPTSPTQYLAMGRSRELLVMPVTPARRTKPGRLGGQGVVPPSAPRLLRGSRSARSLPRPHFLPLPLGAGLFGPLPRLPLCGQGFEAPLPPFGTPPEFATEPATGTERASAEPVRRTATFRIFRDFIPVFLVLG